MKRALAIGAVSLAVSLVSLLSLTTPAFAAQPGQLCQTNQAYLFSDPNSGGSAYEPAGSYFRIVAYGTSTTYYGHFSGTGNNYIPRSIIAQWTCH